MPLTWDEVVKKKEFQSLPLVDKETARRQYFEDVVAPRISSDDHSAALSQFLTDTQLSMQGSISTDTSAEYRKQHPIQYYLQRAVEGSIGTPQETVPKTAFQVEEEQRDKLKNYLGSFSKGLLPFIPQEVPQTEADNPVNPLISKVSEFSGMGTALMAGEGFMEGLAGPVKLAKHPFIQQMARSAINFGGYEGTKAVTEAVNRLSVDGYTSKDLKETLMLGGQATASGATMGAILGPVSKITETAINGMTSGLSPYAAKRFSEYLLGAGMQSEAESQQRGFRKLKPETWGKFKWDWKSEQGFAFALVGAINENPFENAGKFYEKLFKLNSGENLQGETAGRAKRILESPEIQKEINLQSQTPEGKTYTETLKETVDQISKRPGLQAIMKGKAEPIYNEEANAQADKLINNWLGKQEWGKVTTTVEKNQLLRELESFTGEKIFSKNSQALNEAMQIYIDSKNNPGQITERWNLMTPEQRSIVNLSKNLPPELTPMLDKISGKFKEIATEDIAAGVIRSEQENYTNRIWDLGEGRPSNEASRKFGTTSRHAKPRVFDTIVEGWTTNKNTGQIKQSPREPGFELKVKGIADSLAIREMESIKTRAAKELIKQLYSMKDINGEPLLLLSENPEPGYDVKINHPQFKKWLFADTAEPQEISGKSFFQTKEGTILENRELYAAKPVAQKINNILGSSALREIRGVKEAMEIQNDIKSMILSSNFFHPLAFMRNLYFGSNLTKEVRKNIKSGDNIFQAVGKLSPKQSYEFGQKAMENFDPQVKLLFMNGLTAEPVSEFQEVVNAPRKSIFTKISGKPGEKLSELNQQWSEYWFGKVRTGLKIKTGIISMQDLLKKYPGIEPNKAASIASEYANNVYGGLNLKRFGRNPTAQDISSALVLAPDWTESNFRMMRSAVKPGAEGTLYRNFWGNAALKIVATNVLLNIILHGKETSDVYKKAWKAGNLKFMDVDFTPVYKILGGDTDEKKYLSIAGHFKDPIKMFTKNKGGYPLAEFAYDKSSPFIRTGYESLKGEDFRGRQFTELPELVRFGTTTRPPFTFAGKPAPYSQVPSMLIHAGKSFSPTQVQNLINWHFGEMDGFDAVINSLGAQISSTYVPNEGIKKQERILRKEILKMHKEEEPVKLRRGHTSFSPPTPKIFKPRGL